MIEGMAKYVMWDSENDSVVDIEEMKDMEDMNIRLESA
jgi:hypothetical protein